MMIGDSTIKEPEGHLIARFNQSEEFLLKRLKILQALIRTKYTIIMDE